MAQPTPIQATPASSGPSRCVDDEFIAGVSRALKALGEAASRLTGSTLTCISDHEPFSRGHFRPAEEENLFAGNDDLELDGVDAGLDLRSPLV